MKIIPLYMANSNQGIINQIKSFLGPLLFLVLILLISLLFPSSLKFKYEYERQQTWRYDDLIAPFDFPIKKSKEDIETERTELINNTTPVYEIDLSVEVEHKLAFTQAVQSVLQDEQIKEQFKDAFSFPTLYIDYGVNFLDLIYKQGIIQLAASHQNFTADQLITIIRANTAEETSLGNIYTLAAANKLLEEDLAAASLKDSDFLLPLLKDRLQVNLFFSPSKTKLFQKESTVASISPYHGLVKQGALIVAKDGIITNDIYQILLSYEDAYKEQVSPRQSDRNVFAGYLILTILVVLIFGLYIRKFNPYIYVRNRKLIFILMWVVLYSYLVYLTEGVSAVSPYVIPFCIVPIVIKTFFNEKVAMFTHLVIVLIASYLSSIGYEFIFLQVVAGIVVILGNYDTRHSARFFTALSFIFISYSVAYLGLSLIKESSLNAIDWSVFKALFLNVFLTLLAYPLIPLLERLFGFVSPITLIELSDMNRPLLRTLALKAPGTLQHSLQVGNLAEAAARKIGADHLLAKVAALYHDIGKTKNPHYFIENQAGGRNPHDKKTEKESATIIISHVSEGVKMAKKAGLPPVLINFILSHHGTTRTEYFYRKHIHDNPTHKCENDNCFRYPGPKPVSKEETILMLADSVEAACKSLKTPSLEELHAFIDKIFETKINAGQLKNSLLSFRDIESCRCEFKQILKSVYHARVAYPEEE